MAELTAVDAGVLVVFLMYVSTNAFHGFLSASVRLLTLLAVTAAVLYVVDWLVAEVSLPLVPEEYAFEVVAASLVLLMLFGGKWLAHIAFVAPGRGVVGSVFGGMVGFVNAFVLCMIASVLVSYTNPAEVAKWWERSVLLPYVGATTKVTLALLPAPAGSFAAEVKELGFTESSHQPEWQRAEAADADTVVEDESEEEAEEAEGFLENLLRIKEKTKTLTTGRENELEEILSHR